MASAELFTDADVELVAEALYLRAWDGHPEPPPLRPWAEFAADRPADAEFYRRKARAVLEALTAAGCVRTPVARIVAEHWRDAAAEHGWAATGHALAMVLTALGGETDPTRLGIPDGHPDADRITAVTEGSDHG